MFLHILHHQYYSTLTVKLYGLSRGWRWATVPPTGQLTDSRYSVSSWKWLCSLFQTLMSVHGGLITVVGVWCVRTLRAHSDVGLNLSASAGLPRTLMATVLVGYAFHNTLPSQKHWGRPHWFPFNVLLTWGSIPFPASWQKSVLVPSAFLWIHSNCDEHRCMVIRQ